MYNLEQLPRGKLLKNKNIRKKLVSWKGHLKYIHYKSSLYKTIK